MNIAVIGAGYVGYSNALVLSIHNKVVCFDSSQNVVNLINQNQSPINDPDAKELALTNSSSISASMDLQHSCNNADYIIFAVPTNYDDKTKCFDTEVLIELIKTIASLNQFACFVIRSTIPIGFTESLQALSLQNEIIFVPEFLREGLSIHDALYPSRIIIGCKTYSPKAETFAKILLESTKEEDAEILHMNPTEAETVKLFANTYLAMRVSFFNELDTFALEKSLDARAIIDGLSLDPRIGDYYNNPSFGYGGYCLPKDTKQMLSSFEGIPQAMIQATVHSNDLRKKFLVRKIIEKLGGKSEAVGVFRLLMKSKADNFRSAAIMDIMLGLELEGIEMIIFEPNISENDKALFPNYIFLEDLSQFKQRSAVIIANRRSSELQDVSEKVFSRDIYGKN